MTSAPTTLCRAKLFITTVNTQNSKYFTGVAIQSCVTQLRVIVTQLRVIVTQLRVIVTQLRVIGNANKTVNKHN
jgi:hypothetical protein